MILIRKVCSVLTALILGLMVAGSSHAAFLIEVDIDGADDAVLTFSPNFGFGGDTTTASQSSPSSAVGLTGGDSIFGGDGVDHPDTYVYSYNPAVDSSNIDLGAGTALNDDGDVASGIAAGGSGIYNVYATWPGTQNVSGGPIIYTLTDNLDAELFSVSIEQNDAGNEWIFLASAALDAGLSYTLTQESTSNTFVSMRSAGVLFDPVPEPVSMSLLGLGGLLIVKRRRV